MHALLGAVWRACVRRQQKQKEEEEEVQRMEVDEGAGEGDTCQDRRRLAIIRLLVDKFPHLLTCVDRPLGRTALHWAASSGYLSAVQ